MCQIVFISKKIHKIQIGIGLSPPLAIWPGTRSERLLNIVIGVNIVIAAVSTFT